MFKKFKDEIINNYGLTIQLSYEQAEKIYEIFGIDSDRLIISLINKFLLCGYNTNLPIEEIYKEKITSDLNKSICAQIYKYFFQIQFYSYSQNIQIIINTINIDNLIKIKTLLINALGDDKYIELKYLYKYYIQNFDMSKETINKELSEISKQIINLDVIKNEYLIEIYQLLLNSVTNSDIINMVIISNKSLKISFQEIIKEMGTLIKLNYINNDLNIEKIIDLSKSEYTKFKNIFLLSEKLVKTKMSSTNIISNDLKMIKDLINNKITEKIVNTTFFIEKTNIYECLYYIKNNNQQNICQIEPKIEYINDIINFSESNNLSVGFAYFKDKRINSCKDSLYSQILVNSIQSLIETIFTKEIIIENPYIGSAKILYSNNIIKEIVFCLVCPTLNITADKRKISMNIYDEFGIFYSSFALT